MIAQLTDVLIFLFSTIYIKDVGLATNATTNYRDRRHLRRPSGVSDVPERDMLETS